MISPRILAINNLIWWLVAALALLDAVLIFALGIVPDTSYLPPFLLVAPALFALMAIYRYLRRDDPLCLFAGMANQLVCATIALGILSYITATANFPLLDARLVAMDHALHFDWRDYVLWIDQFPLPARALSYAYVSSGAQIFVIVCLLFLTRHTAHIQRFILAFLLTALTVILLAMLFPALGGYEYYHIEPGQFAHIRPAAGTIHLQPLLALREHTPGALAFPLRGLVTFPSFHCGLSILLLYACRPVRLLFWLALPLNLLVLLSTPADGGHYLVDILSGIAVAAIAIAIIERALRKSA